ncbi:hypothetical protein AXG93_4476s1020 [Marchantia polymorpha subsp. ruderalis]|uniref:Uncharacterized protein n=1 Tax=Marchantia polymorpha subsp. ruderalis TaxID=1480154 RepID=A0A176W562_MARPO|nr:hypothetical protein AXG93_4476s1020 [Marchantia polymorpha subsp. ruderalis]
MAHRRVLRPNEACSSTSGDAHLTAATWQTKSEEKRFSKEREVLTFDSDKCIEEEDDVQIKEPPRRTAQRPVRLDVVTVEDQSDRRLAKKQKIADASGEGQRPESQMPETQVMKLKTPKRRARPKKKANRKIVVFESLEASVAISEVAASAMDEDTMEEPNLQTEGAGPLRLKAVTEQLEALRTRVKEAEAAFCQLKEETTNSLRLRMKKSLCRFVMCKFQTLKWMKLDLLERRLMSMKTNGTSGQKQLVRLLNSFSFGLEEIRENLELEILGVLRRLGADESLKHDVITASDDIAPESSSPRVVEMSRSLE